MTHAKQVNNDHRKCEPADLFHRRLRPARYAATAGAWQTFSNHDNGGNHNVTGGHVLYYDGHVI